MLSEWGRSLYEGRSLPDFLPLARFGLGTPSPPLFPGRRTYIKLWYQMAMASILVQ